MLTAKQKNCIKLMAYGSMAQKEIAAELKISEQTICNWKKNEEFTTALDEAVRASIRSLASKAVYTQNRLLNAKSEMVRYMVSKDILDRAGFAAENNVNITGSTPIQIIDDIPRDTKTEGH